MTVAEAILTHLTGIEDTGAPGRVHGGVVLRLCDEVAAVSAMKHAHQGVVTAGVDRVEFLAPILVGEVVTLKARVNAAWRTSVEVGVRVEAESLSAGDVRHVLSAYFTMVAVDADGRPVPVPELTPEDDESQRRLYEADVRRSGRLKERQDLAVADGES